MKILVINAGSSSLKYQVFDMALGKMIAKGLCDRIGVDGTVTHKRPGKENYQLSTPLNSHDDAIAIVLRLLTDPELGVLKNIEEIGAVGHRIVHGGEKITESTILGPKEKEYLYSIVGINPLHGPPALKGLEACQKLLPDVNHVGVFDTSFYSHMPQESYIYPLPYEYYETYKIRRYGFHGTSHRYVSQKAAEYVGKDLKDLKMITCHLGNGSSISAIDGGVCVDTTMGFTPQEGLPMGTRSGSFDPTVVTYLMDKLGISPAEMDNIMNRKSGLLGMSGVSSDYREVAKAAAEGNPRAKLALDVLYHSIVKIIGSFAAEMNGLDVVVFTAGIGENAAAVREEVSKRLSFLGVEIDIEKNRSAACGEFCDISKEGARAKVLAIPTDEEYMIALDTFHMAKK